MFMREEHISWQSVLPDYCYLQGQNSVCDESWVFNKYWAIYGQQKFLLQYFPGDNIGNKVEFPLTSNISIKICMWVGLHLSQALRLYQGLAQDLEPHSCSAYSWNKLYEGRLSQIVIFEPSSFSLFLQKNLVSKPKEIKLCISHPPDLK